MCALCAQLPYDYYSLPFCRPSDMSNAVENLGEVLHGSVIQNSPYDPVVGKSDFKVLCKRDLDVKAAVVLAQRIKQEYRVHMIMDNLPAATKMIREMPDGKTITMYDRGYPLGFIGSSDRPGSLQMLHDDCVLGVACACGLRARCARRCQSRRRQRQSGRPHRPCRGSVYGGWMF